MEKQNNQTADTPDDATEFATETTEAREGTSTSTFNTARPTLKRSLTTNHRCMFSSDGNRNVGVVHTRFVYNNVHLNVHGSNRDELLYAWVHTQHSNGTIHTEKMLPEQLEGKGII